MRSLSALILLALLIAACGQQSGEQGKKATLKSTIAALKDSMNKAEERQQIRKHARKLARKAGKFTDTYPKDSMTPEYLYMLGDVHFSYLKNAETALSSLKELQDKFPGHEKAPLALFTRGFFYEQLSNTQKAKQQYQRFLKQYPDHELAEDVRLSMKSLGQSPSEQLQEALEKRGKSDSIQ